MGTTVKRVTVDLGSYPELVVIYLGMRARSVRGAWNLMRLGNPIDEAGAQWPDGLLHYDNRIVYSLFPLHVGMRWYWRDFDAMERWARSEPHSRWWRDFHKDSAGTGFWHETYRINGGMEAVYDDVTGTPIGFLGFAPTLPAVGPMLSARSRLAASGVVLPPEARDNGGGDAPAPPPPP